MIPVQKSFPPERLRYMRARMKTPPKPIPVSWITNFKLHQEQMQWVYMAIGLPALGLIVGLLVAGGCR